MPQFLCIPFPTVVSASAWCIATVRFHWSYMEEFKLSLVSSSVCHSHSPNTWHIVWWNRNFSAAAAPHEMLRISLPLIHYLLSRRPDCSQTKGSPLSHSPSVEFKRATACKGVEWKQFPEMHYNWNGKNQKDSRLSQKLESVWGSKHTWKDSFSSQTEMFTADHWQKFAVLSRMFSHLYF